MPKKIPAKLNNKEIAIKVDHVSKTFRIPHEKVTSVRGVVVGLPATLGSALGVGAMKRNKGYEEFKALDDVSFEVKKGEFFGIIGRNGSGKSTLLKILAGIYQADKGKVKVHGMISPFLELGIGFNPELSGRDNVYLNATVLGMSKKQIDKKFDSIVQFSELERFIDQKLKNYSSGMQVRLAFSVSIHANRDILLMDEVLAVGDANFSSKCLTEFARYKEMGKTVILVTHDIATVQRYCDRAMLLRNGKILKIGDPEDVGNEYMYQNMSDEEKRMFDEEKENIANAEKDLEKMKGKELAEEKKRIEEEKRKQEEERKNKVAEITKVEFLDKDGKSKNVFETGASVDIKVSFSINNSVADFNVGIGLYSETNERVFSYHTYMDNFKIKEESGFITLHFDKLPVLKGNYYLNVACFSGEEKMYYDIKQKYKKLKIFTPGQKGRYKGILNIAHSWKN